MELKELRNIPFDLNVLSAVYPNIASISNKAMELERTGKIIRLKKGYYVVSPDKSDLLLSDGLIANHIYGPSYVSMETALRYYELIPERIRVVRSMTVKHTRRFENAVGNYEYIQCPTDYFHIGITMKQDSTSSYLIATPEKALCDLLLSQPTTSIRFQRELKKYLEEDLRLDMNRFHCMDKEIFCECMSAGKKKQLIKNLIKLI